MDATNEGDSLFQQARGQEILAALRAHEPERALRLAEHLVLESGNPTGDPRQGRAMLAAAAFVAQQDARADRDREYDYREAVAPWCNEDELRQGAMMTLYSQGTSQGWLAAPLYDLAAPYFQAMTGPFAEGFADIERRDL
ncbi:MAG: hypothetical protein ABIQ18_48520 [Umezawaea sp.]